MAVIHQRPEITAVYQSISARHGMRPPDTRHLSRRFPLLSQKCCS